MDSGVEPCHSLRLAGLPSSTSPPPLGERNRQSRWTTSHIDSHTMGDHENKIPELSSPPHEVGEEDPIPVYDPSPDIPTHSKYNPSFTGFRYWLPSNETHHEPVSTHYVSYGMSSIPVHDLTQHAESEFEPNTTLGGTPIPFHVEIFWEHESHYTLHPNGGGYITCPS